MAEIFYLKGKKYNCTINGKPYFRKSAVIDGKQRSFYGDGEKDAIKKIEEAKNLSQQGLVYDKRNAKVGSVFKHWIYNVKRVDKDLKPSSFSRYECSFRLHVESNSIADVVLSKLDSSRMQVYVNDLFEEEGLSGANIQAVVKVWKMFCTWAQDEGYFVKNPCRNIVLPGKRDKGTKNKFETFTSEERKQIVEYMKESSYQYDTLILLAFATGMRKGELLSLRWEDIQGGIIHVQRSTALVTHVDKNGNRDRYREVWDPKTVNSEREIPILPEVETMLQEHSLAQKKYFFKRGKKIPDYIFTTDNGELIDPSSLTKSYKRMLARAGVPYRKFHAIRHTFATEAIRSGVNVKDLQILMGHSDIETTYQYVHANGESQRDAIELLGRMW